LSSQSARPDGVAARQVNFSLFNHLAVKTA
jgi:hypothetical protein